MSEHCTSGCRLRIDDQSEKYAREQTQTYKTCPRRCSKLLEWK